LAPFWEEQFEGESLKPPSLLLEQQKSEKPTVPSEQGVGNPSITPQESSSNTELTLTAESRGLRDYDYD
jgi:hypothetical protein